MDDAEQGAFAARWDQLVGDMEATANEYGGAWTTVELHPGDVAVIDEDADDPGLDVLVPGDEFETLRDAVADRTVDSYEVMRGEDAGIVYLLLVLEDTADEVAVFVPGYYEREDREDLQSAVEDGRLTVYVRQLDGEERVEFDLADPEPLFPDE